MAAGDLVTMPFHLEWRGLLLGWPLSSATLAGLSGWKDSPQVRNKNAERPGRHGMFPGQLRAGSRIVEASFRLGRVDPAVLPAIEAVTGLDEDPAEEPLVIWAGTDAPQMVMARVIRRAVPTDYAWSVGDERATIQWEATDPHRYSVAAVTGSIGLPSAAVGGLSFPLSFPLVFGTGGQSGGVATLTNTGNAATWPFWTVTGPITGPIIRNADTGEQLLFDPAFTVTAGQTMEINTDLRTVEIAGVSQQDKLRVRQWFPLAKEGTTTIQLTSTGAYDPAASLSWTYRHANM